MLQSDKYLRPRPILPTANQAGSNRVFNDVCQYPLGGFVAATDVIISRPLPQFAMTAELVKLVCCETLETAQPVADRSSGTLRIEQHVQMIRHQEKTKYSMFAEFNGFFDRLANHASDARFDGGCAACSGKRRTIRCANRHVNHSGRAIVIIRQPDGVRAFIRRSLMRRYWLHDFPTGSGRAAATFGGVSPSSQTVAIRPVPLRLLHTENSSGPATPGGPRPLRLSRRLSRRAPLRCGDRPAFRIFRQ